ncbi:MAG: toll/interleukin-1 receptor domain-containing protein, partial [Anaerolineae bacterium]|nr:toll/interleukin-1 receptor domain-containing protein [Anaerolineae bacterium]
MAVQQLAYNDVFVSYSRKNRDFAKQLVEAITSREDQEVWVDWEDIEFAVDWWERIQAGIESANAFLFIISPDSVRSKVCFDETEHATRMGKRIIPILHQDVTEAADLDRMHPAVKQHNWLPFRPEDDFDAVFPTLMETIRMDFHHTRMHTRLLVRAREWEETGRQSGRLLTGIEIQEAEDWLKSADAEAKEPIPIDLQREYIRASRQSQRRRQQQLMVGAFIGIAMGFLALLSFLLFNNAQSNLTLAEARGTEVAVEAQNAATSEREARNA